MFLGVGRPLEDSRFSAGRVALLETVQGLDKTISGLKGLRFDAEANTRRGFSGLALPGLQVGPGGFQRALGAFRDRWSRRARSLVQDGNQFGFRAEITAVVHAGTADYLTRIPGAAFALGMVVRLPGHGEANC